MHFNKTIIGVGILAGLASALMSSGVLIQSGLAMALYFLTPLPIFVAALGWGSSAGVVAAIAATLSVGLFTAPMAAVLVALISFIPAAYGAYLCGLARSGEELGGPKNSLVWYPLSDLIFRLALIVSVSFILVGAIIGYGPEMARELAAEVILRLQEADSQFTATPEAHDNIASLLMFILPAMQPAVTLLALIANLYLALRLNAMSGRLRRPRDDWPSSLRLPRLALPVLAVALALSFTSGTIAQIATVFVGAIGLGFTLSGFAVMHMRSRGKNWRAALLWLAYIAVILVSPVILVFFVLGLLDTTRTAPISQTPDNENESK